MIDHEYSAVHCTWDMSTFQAEGFEDIFMIGYSVLWYSNEFNVNVFRLVVFNVLSFELIFSSMDFYVNLSIEI